MASFTQTTANCTALPAWTIEPSQWITRTTAWKEEHGLVSETTGHSLTGWMSHRAYVNAAESSFCVVMTCQGPSSNQSLLLHCVYMCACTSDEVQGTVRSRTVEFKNRQRIFPLIVSKLSDAHVVEMEPCKFNHVYCGYREKCRQLYSTPAPSGLSY